MASGPANSIDVSLPKGDVSHEFGFDTTRFQCTWSPNKIREYCLHNIFKRGDTSTILEPLSVASLKILSITRNPTRPDTLARVRPSPLTGDGEPVGSGPDSKGRTPFAGWNPSHDTAGWMAIVSTLTDGN